MESNLKKNINYEALFFTTFLVVLGLGYLFIGIVKNGSMNIFGVKIEAEYIFKFLVIFSLSVMGRKLLLAEQQWRSTFQESVEKANRNFLEDVKASVPLSSMRFIDNEKDWYQKAISMLQDRSSFSTSGRAPQNVIFASTSVVNVSKSELLSQYRLDYFYTIAKVCCSSGDAPQYQLLLSPGNSTDTHTELNARLAAFDKIISNAQGGNSIRDGWAGAQMQIRVAEVSGIDFVIYGDSVLFNLRTYKDENRPERKGIYVNDANIAQTFQRWFQSIYEDATNCKYINAMQAQAWNLSSEHAKKLGVTEYNEDDENEQNTKSSRTLQTEA